MIAAPASVERVENVFTIFEIYRILKKRLITPFSPSFLGELCVGLGFERL